MPAGQPSNLHQLYMRGMHPLGVECLGCNRRALVAAERFGACKGDMREINSLRLVCSSCGARDWHGTVFNGPEEAEAWRDGRLVVSPPVGGPPTF